MRRLVKNYKLKFKPLYPCFDCCGTLYSQDRNCFDVFDKIFFKDYSTHPLLEKITIQVEDTRNLTHFARLLVYFNQHYNLCKQNYI